MGERHAAVDTYIANAQPFARPILEHLREVVHAACPEVEEKMKWSFPHFDYKGMLCSMAAFKGHAAFGFWKHGLLAEQGALAAGMNRGAMGSFGRLASVDDLPPRRVLVALVKQAMKLNDAGLVSPHRSKPRPRPPIAPPRAFTAALAKHAKARAAWHAFAPGHRREYLEWITEAKTDATRDARIATTIAWVAEGKARNWKYAKPAKRAAKNVAPARAARATPKRVAAKTPAKRATPKRRASRA